MCSIVSYADTVCVHVCELWRYLQFSLQNDAHLKVHFLNQCENSKTWETPIYIYWMGDWNFPSHVILLLYLFIYAVIFIRILNIKLIEFADLMEFCNFIYIFDGHNLTQNKQTNTLQSK